MAPLPRTHPSRAVAAQAGSPRFRRHVTPEILARMLGYLVASMGPYGDQLERPRRNRPLTPSAELIWQQLPPLTAATDGHPQEVRKAVLPRTAFVGPQLGVGKLRRHPVVLAPAAGKLSALSRLGR